MLVKVVEDFARVRVVRHHMRAISGGLINVGKASRIAACASSRPLGRFESGFNGRHLLRSPASRFDANRSGPLSFRSNVKRGPRETGSTLWLRKLGQ